MIIIPPELVVSSALTFGQITSRGTSPTACFIAKASDESRERFQSSVFLGLRATGVFDDLSDVFVKSQKPGWDGGSAEPVAQDTYRNAYRFLESLPPAIQAPSIGVEPDGHITLEWYKAPRHTISVSISPQGFLYYSALMGLRKANGSEPFFGDVPKIILELICKVYA